MNNFVQAWKSFLAEGKTLLQEFNKDDLAAVKADGDSFTISYEVELESTGNMIFPDEGMTREEANDEVIGDPDQLDNYFAYNVGSGAATVDYEEILNDFEGRSSGWTLGRHYNGNEPLYTSAVPFIFGLQALHSKGQAQQSIVELFRNYRNPEMLNRFIQASFYESQPLLDADIKLELEQDVIRLDSSKKLRDYVHQNKIDSILDAYAGGSLPEDISKLFIEEFSYHMEVVQANYFFIFNKTNTPIIDFGYNCGMTSFPIEVFMTIFGMAKFHKTCEAIGYKAMSLAGNMDGESNDLGEYSMNLNDFAASYSLYSGAGKDLFITRFIDFYIEDTNSYIDQVVDEMIEGQQATRDASLFDLHEEEIEEAYRLALKTHLPSFYRAYGDVIKVESDASLQQEKGLEFSMADHLNSLDEAYDFLNAFYDEYEKQSFFEMTKRTGLHINIGYKGIGGETKDKEFNLIKGYLFLNEEERARMGLAQSRKQSHWTNAIMSGAKSDFFANYLMSDKERMSKAAFDKNYSKKMIDQFIQGLKTGEPSEIEELFSNNLLQAAYSTGPKSIGFNINYSRMRDGNDYVKYIEFRYPGHDISRETAIDLTNYYCHVVKTMSDPTYKRKEYLSKFVGLLNQTVQQEIKVTKPIREILKPGMVVYLPIGKIWRDKIGKESVSSDINEQTFIFYPAEVWNWLVSASEKKFLNPRQLETGARYYYTMPVLVTEVDQTDDLMEQMVTFKAITPQSINQETTMIIEEKSLPMANFLSTFNSFGMNTTLSVKPKGEKVTSNLFPESPNYQTNALSLRRAWNRIESLFSENGGKIQITPNYHKIKK